MPERHARAAGRHRLRRGARGAVVGPAPRRVRVASPFLLRTVDPPLARRRRARRSSGVRRLGKRIVFALEDELFLVIHLMIAGRLHWQAAGAKVPGRIGARRVRLPDRHADPHRGGHEAARVAAPGAGRGGARRRSIAAGSSCSTPTLEAFARGAAPREPHAQARAHRSAPLQRHRQRLLGRDPAPRPALAAAATRQAGRRRRSRRLFDATQGDAGRVDGAAAREARRRLPGEGHGVPRRRWRCTAGTASRARTAARRCSGSSTRRTRRTTAPRCQTGGQAAGRPGAFAAAPGGLAADASRSSKRSRRPAAPNPANHHYEDCARESVTSHRSPCLSPDQVGLLQCAPCSVQIGMTPPPVRLQAGRPPPTRSRH